MIEFRTLYSLWLYDSLTNRIKRVKSRHAMDEPFLSNTWVQLQVAPEIVKGQKVALVVDKDDKYAGLRYTGNVEQIRFEGELTSWMPDELGRWVHVGDGKVVV